MNMKTVFVAIVIILTIVLLSVFIILLNTNEKSGLTIGLKETIPVDITERQFSVLDGNVEINVHEGSVSEPINITVETIKNPVENASLHMFSCFDFGPDGLTFAKPIDIMVCYNVDDLPEGVDESDIKLHVLTNNIWEPIAGSFANKTTHCAVASVSHFSQISCCGSCAPSSGDKPDDEVDDTKEDDATNSSQYWFKADMYYYNYKSPRVLESDHEDHYFVGVSAYWEPVSYVQYYQIKFVFNDNQPEDYGWSYNYREQGRSYASPSPYNRKEGKIYHLGGNPEIEGYIGEMGTGEATIGKLNPDSGEVETTVYGRNRPEGTHGQVIFLVEEDIDDYEELSPAQIDELIYEMQVFVEEYVEGWEIWVRGVTETQE